MQQRHDALRLKACQQLGCMREHSRPVEAREPGLLDGPGHAIQRARGRPGSATQLPAPQSSKRPATVPRDSTDRASSTASRISVPSLTRAPQPQDDRHLDGTAPDRYAPAADSGIGIGL